MAVTYIGSLSIIELQNELEIGWFQCSYEHWRHVLRLFLGSSREACNKKFFKWARYNLCVHQLLRFFLWFSWIGIITPLALSCHRCYASGFQFKSHFNRCHHVFWPTRRPFLVSFGFGHRQRQFRSVLFSFGCVHLSVRSKSRQLRVWVSKYRQKTETVNWSPGQQQKKFDQLWRLTLGNLSRWNRGIFPDLRP